MDAVNDTRMTYDMPEVAERLGISERHAYELARSGSLPGVIKLGRRWLLPRAKLLELLGEPVPA